MGDQTDQDMHRATDLVDLHYNVKGKHLQGNDRELKQARHDVDAVLLKLDGKSHGGQRAG